MTTSRHYQNAPIIEALIDIRAQLPVESHLEMLQEVFAKVKQEYPKKVTRDYVQGHLSLGDEVGISAKQTPMGFVCYSKDGTQVFQARLDGFTFSRLKPYENWFQLRDEAKRLWDIYSSVMKPVRINRVALRYINQIDIPLPMKDFKDYLRTTPEISPDLPQGLSGFFMQLQIPQDDFGGLLMLTQTIVPPRNPSVVSVILDIDVFKTDADLSLESDVWSLLEVLRSRKNDFFEGCITNQCRALFGPWSD